MMMRGGYQVAKPNPSTHILCNISQECQEMTGNASLSRKQTLFLQGLLLGQTIVAAAAAVGINEKTAYRWLKLPHIQAERERLETELRTAEEQEITRIMTTGYAAIHERVKALDAMAREVEKAMKDSKGEYVPTWMYPERLREWRGMLDDIAKETGARVTAKGSLKIKSDGPMEFTTEWGGGSLEEDDESEA